MGTVVQVIEAPGGYSVGTTVPELFVAAGTTQPPCWAYTNPGGSFISVMFPARAINYGGGNLSVDIDWYSTAGSVTGSVTWLVSVTSVSAGAAESVEAATGGTQASVASTVNATAKGLTRANVSIAPANLDGMAAGSDIWVNVQRSSGDTTLAGIAALKCITLSYGDGLTGTPGSGDFVGPAGATATAVVKYADATGKLGANSGVLIDASNNVTGLGTINTRTIATLATGPGTSTAGRVATFASADGITLANGPRLEADLVAGPASATDTALMRFSGTGGKTAQNSGILVDASNNVTGMGTLNTRTIANLVTGPGAAVVSGNIMSWIGTGGAAAQDSGVSATAHAARHNPGGADAMFTSTWAAGDVAKWNGTIWVPKFVETLELSATASISSGAGTLADVTGLTVALPRAGTYRFICRGAVVTSGTAGHLFCAMNYTGTVTRIVAGGTYYLAGTAAGFMYFVQVANKALSSTTGAGTATNGTQGICLDGCITVSTTGTLSWRFARASASTTATIQTATGFTVWED